MQFLRLLNQTELLLCMWSCVFTLLQACCAQKLAHTCSRVPFICSICSSISSIIFYFSDKLTSIQTIGIAIASAVAPFVSEATLASLCKQCSHPFFLCLLTHSCDQTTKEAGELPCCPFVNKAAIPCFFCCLVILFTLLFGCGSCDQTTKGSYLAASSRGLPCLQGA